MTLMDMRMPRLDGISATRRLAADDPPLTRVVVLTTFDVDSHVYDALRAGASGFLLKNAPPEELVRRSAWWRPAGRCSTPPSPAG